MKKLKIVFLACGGFLTLAAVLFLLFVKYEFSRHQISILKSAASPDAAYTAVVYSDEGGGAGGWCYVCVDVTSSVGELDAASARCLFKKQQVFRCNTQVTLQWTAPGSVAVLYDGEPMGSTPPASADRAVSAPTVSISYQKL